MFENDDQVISETTQESASQSDRVISSAPLTPVVPLSNAGPEQYQMIRDYRDLALQNFKMLLYTFPGERVMDVNFGVGIRKYLFEINSYEVKSELSERIEEQVSEYLPYISIESITFPDSENSNLLSIKIMFTIDTLNVQEEIIIEQEII